MEENQCYAIVKRPPHKSWIMSLYPDHGAKMINIGKHPCINSVFMDGFINQVQINRSQVNTVQHLPKSHSMGSVDQT
eukprot:1649772-Amphidinium_carterae.2